MGKQIYLKSVQQLFEKSPVVDFKSIQRIVGKKSKKNNYAKLLIYNLLKNKKIKKVGKGMYTMHNEASLSVFSFMPAYLGLQSSLSYHGLWQQEVIPVILSVKKVRRGTRNISGTNILIRNISKRYFFGFEYAKDGDFYVPYSDIEKTFIDMVVFNEPIDEELLKEFRKKVDKKKLNGYVKKYPQNIRHRVEKKISLLKRGGK